MNALFRNECATLRKEYAKTYKRPVGPIDSFKSEMFTLEDANRGSVTYLVAMVNYARKEEKAREARSEIPARCSGRAARGDGQVVAGRGGRDRAWRDKRQAGRDGSLWRVANGTGCWAWWEERHGQGGVGRDGTWRGRIGCSGANRADGAVRSGALLVAGVAGQAAGRAG